MSLSCIVGMHDIIWHNPGSNHQQSLFHKDRHKTHTTDADPDNAVAQQYANYIRSNINTARIAASSTGVAVSKNSLFNVNGSNTSLKGTDSEEIGFLFDGGGKAGGHWSVADDNPPQQNGNALESLDSNYSDRTRKENLWEEEEKKTISSKSATSSDMFRFENHWQDDNWGVGGDSSNDKSEHAISQPIMVQRRQAEGYGPQQSQSVTSPRSADGSALGVHMVEYVLASSPGGHELENRMKELNMNGDLGPGESTQHLTNGNMVITRKSPFDEEQEDGETISSESSEPATYLNHQHGSRGQSPSLSQQDGTSQLGATILSNGPSSSKPSSTSSGQTAEDQMTSPVPFVSQPSESAVPVTGGMENSNMNYTAVQMQMQGMTISSEGMTQQQQMQQVQQQQQQQVISSQQQHQQQTYIMQQQQAMQQAGIQMGSSPYFMASAQAGQDPYNGQGISIVNANGQTAVIHPQYAAAYGISPYMYNANGNTYIQQQMPQSAGQVRTPTTSTASGQVPQPQQQQISGVPAGYQVIQTPLNIPAGSTFYDQHGNPVIINGRIAAPMAGAQIGQPVRMVSPMVINANGQPTVSPGIHSGTSPSMQQIYGQQQQQPTGGQQQQGEQQPRQSAINLGYLSTGQLGPLPGQNAMPMQNGGPVGVIGGHLQNSTNGPLPSPGARRDYSTLEMGKRTAVQPVYHGMGSYNSLNINTPLANLAMSNPNTSPLHTQGQSSFEIGSPASSRLSNYMGLLGAQRDNRYGGGGNVASIFGSTSGGSLYRRNGRDSGRSKLLEDFRNNRYPNLQLHDLQRHIVEFSQDQHGSRFIQQKLERASILEKNMVFNEILTAAYSLMTDVFGNYVIQKFFEFGSPDQKLSLAQRIKGHVLPLALQMYGCRVIQKALETIPPDMPIHTELVRELDGHVLKCVKDQNGNHVVQKCIECVESTQLQFIIDAFKGQVFALSTHPYGCRVIQRILEHCTIEQTSPILLELHEHTERLVQDQYGNYVIQHVLEHGSPDDKTSIVNIVRGNVLMLSQHKFASNVVEKCVSHASRAERSALIDEVCNYADGPHGALYTMMKDQYANYVVQKMIDVAELYQRKILMQKIRPHIATLRKYTYGKHILAKLESFEKAYMQPADLLFLPATTAIPPF